ncbi:hypothetical protein [Rothia nasimurium]|uniref:hypothetical protein n=1 Tax=Rothia nasimurium TaxID=85336 RepID=UPI001F230493|nr:hypothetical protein [Rothia nasimurium]
MSTPNEFPPVLVGTIDAEAIWTAVKGEQWGATYPPTYGYVMNAGKPTVHLTISNLDDSTSTDELALALKRHLAAATREFLTPYFERFAKKRGEEQEALNRARMGASAASEGSGSVDLGKGATE